MGWNRHHIQKCPFVWPSMDDLCGRYLMELRPHHRIGGPIETIKILETCILEIRCGRLWIAERGQPWRPCHDLNFRFRFEPKRVRVQRGTIIIPVPGYQYRILPLGIGLRTAEDIRRLYENKRLGSDNRPVWADRSSSGLSRLRRLVGGGVT